jgi:hypothetical protein
MNDWQRDAVAHSSHFSRQMANESLITLSSLKATDVPIGSISAVLLETLDPAPGLQVMFRTCQIAVSAATRTGQFVFWLMTHTSLEYITNKQPLYGHGNNTTPAKTFLGTGPVLQQLYGRFQLQ